MPLETSHSAKPPNPGQPTFEARGHTTPDGTLNLSIPVGLPDAEVTVILQVTPIRPREDVDENGWPKGFFDTVPGSMPELERGPQGEFEQRLPLG
jgi:hypothetical protein